MASPLSMALKAAPAAMRMAGVLRSANAAPGANSKPKFKINIRVQLPPKASGTANKSSSKPDKPNLNTLGKTARSLSRAASHMHAMGKQPGLGGLLKHGLKAAKELQGAARELSKLDPGHGMRNAETAHPGNANRALAGQAKGLKLMVGQPTKNWEEATPENGFREAYRSKPGADGKSLRVMVGKPQKNWEHATAENGFREAYRGKPGADGKSLRVMVGKPQKNWEHATPENGFTEWRGGKSRSGDAGGPRLQIMIGKPQMNWREALERVTPHEGARARTHSLSDLVKVARQAHVLGKTLAKSQD